MARLPLLSGREVARTFEALGWVIARHASHIILVRAGSTVSLSVPVTRKSPAARYGV